MIRRLTFRLSSIRRLYAFFRRHGLSRIEACRCSLGAR